MASMLSRSDGGSPWWLGETLQVGARGLELDGVPLADVAEQHGTPLYVYGAATLRRRVAQLRAALGSTGLRHRIHYAMKANRCPAVLDLLRDAGLGIDACSPREVALARAHGFASAAISVTAGMLSDRDLRALHAHGVHLNLDTRSALRRYAAIAGREAGPVPVPVGLRIDPGVAIGYGAGTAYGKAKFGFDLDAVEAAAAFAGELGLRVDTLHVHCGWGLQAAALPQLEAVFARLAATAQRLPGLTTLNVGGGLGARQQATDAPLPLEAWAGLLRRHFGALDIEIACEPGTLLVAAAGVLLVEVNTVEARRGTTWVGVDAGHNLNVYPAHYGIPLEVLHVRDPLGEPDVEVTVAGNINEAGDVFARGLRLPHVLEGDRLALYPAGAYGASMASDHCLRGPARELVV